MKPTYKSNTVLKLNTETEPVVSGRQKLKVAPSHSSTASDGSSSDSGDPKFNPWDKIGITWFIVCHILALFAFAHFSWANVAALAIMYFVTECLGITLGFHRLMSHRSFKTHKWVERTLATFGVLTVQRSPLEWVAHHRVHHAFSDQEQDPHNSRRGFWWSHILWILKSDERLDEYNALKPYARDIANDWYMNLLFSKWSHTGLQVAMGMILLAIGGWGMVFWGIFLRLVLGYHFTFFINSVSHKFGYRTYETGDDSRNCWWAAIVTFGEGWHNNHHKFQSIARAGHQWWEVDVTMMVIRLMEFTGLAWDVKDKPDHELIEAANTYKASKVN
jgi:fatty-acid desaturase